jgi:hypothetical protein
LSGISTATPSSFPDQPIWTMLIAATVLAIAALAMIRVKESNA